MLRTFLLFVGLSCVIGYSYAMFSKIYSNQNKASHGKQKRALEPLFVNGNSIVKIVLGVSFPLETYDKVNFRTLNLAYNFQGQYMLAKPARYPWDKVKRSLHNQKRNYSDNKSVVDNTRQLMYNAVEMLMDRKGVNGKECLQRAICENAQSPITVTGVFHEILNLFLTPSEADTQQCYTDARQAGRNHADCSLLYKKCPQGRGIFDSIFHFTH